MGIMPGSNNSTIYLRLIFFIALLIISFSLPVFAEEYSFDISEIEKKPYHIGGYAEFRPVLFGLDRDAALYKLKFYNRDEGSTLDEYNAALQLEGGLEKGIARLFVKTNTDYKKSYLGEDQETTLYEGHLSLKPSPSLTIAMGKQTLKWGKGYAWTPVAFVDRPKDPDEPELALEGFIAASADYIKSFDGPLKTVSFTPVLIPVYDHVNDTFGDINNLGDRSFSLSPELLYTGITNLELRLKAAFLAGGRLSEYGEKQNDYRVEARARYYF